MPDPSLPRPELFTAKKVLAAAFAKRRDNQPWTPLDCFGVIRPDIPEQPTPAK